MPRARNRVLQAAGDARRLERQLKAFRQWMAAEREALEFRDMLRIRRGSARRGAQRRAFFRKLDKSGK